MVQRKLLDQYLTSDKVSTRFQLKVKEISASKNFNQKLFKVRDRTMVPFQCEG